MRQDDSLRLLMISGSRNKTEVLTNHLRNAGYVVRLLRVEDEKRLTAVLRDQEWDLLLHLPDALDLNIATVLALLSDSHRDIPVVVVADEIPPSQKLDLLETGASAVVPSDPPGLLQRAVRRELEGLRLRRALHACQEERQEIERRCQVLLHHTRDAIAYVQEGMHVLANPAYLRTFSFVDADEVVGVPILNVVPATMHALLKGALRTAERSSGDVLPLEIHALRTNGEQFPARFAFTSTVFDGDPCIQVMVDDLSSATEFQKQMDNLNRRDPLTGLYNRQYFLQELDRTFSSHPGVLYLTVDNLAALRSKVGIAGADKLLREVATLIARQAQYDDLVANFGDGVFTILATQGEEVRLRTLSDGILRMIGNCLVEVGGVTISATSSIGLHPASLRAKDSHVLLSRVEAAAATARKSGGNGCAVCSPEGTPTTPAAGNILGAALDKNKLFLVYQPIVYLGGDGRELYEVFPRISGSGAGHPIPENAMQVVDDAHLPAATDRWIVSKALEVLTERLARGKKPTRLWIGISRDTLLDESFPNWLGGKIKASGLPAGTLIFQIQDTLAVDYYLRVRDFVPALHGLGCEFALSHCRGDASVYGQLRQLDVDYFRIDGALIQDLALNREHQTLVQSVNERVHTLGKHTLAESVRDANTLTILWQYGIDYIQGEYLQKPSEGMDYDFSSMFIE